jgi:hypothetical protein
MGYDTNELKERMLNAIEKYNLYTIESVAAFIGVSKGTLYDHKLNESDHIKKAFWSVKEKMKAGLRAKWYKNDVPACQMALYKLLGSEDEYHRIAGTKQEIKQTTIESSQDYEALLKEVEELKKDVKADPKTKET